MLESDSAHVSVGAQKKGGMTLFIGEKVDFCDLETEPSLGDCGPSLP